MLIEPIVKAVMDRKEPAATDSRLSLHFGDPDTRVELRLDGLRIAVYDYEHKFWAVYDSELYSTANLFRLELADHLSKSGRNVLVTTDIANIYLVFEKGYTAYIASKLLGEK